MSLPPTSFRLPFQLPTEDQNSGVHPMVAMAIRYAFSGLVDANNAIAALNTKVAPAVAAAAAGESTQTGGGSETINANVGGVNNQSGLTSYTIQSSDFGALIICDTASPFALSLNNGVGTPFLAVIQNLGTGVVTCTAQTGTVNNQANFELIEGQSGLIFFDGTDFWITTLPQYLLGGSTGAGAVVLDSGAFIISPILDGTIVIDSGSVVSFDSGATANNATFTGITTILGLNVYANNAAAKAAGLTTGALYRSGSDPDSVYIVH
jgi:hypothetical protein